MRAGQFETPPEAVLVFVPAGRRKRLYASMNIAPGARFWQEEVSRRVEWQFIGCLRQMLIITRDTYGECLDELMTIWANRISQPELPPGKPAITSVPARITLPGKPIGKVPVRETCPDQGRCNHHCRATQACFRVLLAGPLSGIYPDDTWPADIRTEHKALNETAGTGVL